MSRTLSLHPFALKRPLKVRWDLDLSNKTTVESVFRSSSLVKLYQSIDNIKEKNQFSFERQVSSREKFVSWLAFYRRKVKEYGYREIANEEWFDQKIAEGKSVEILEISKGGVAVSAGIILKEGLTKATLAFSANERIRISSISGSSLGAMLNCLFMREMSQEHVNFISGGRSRNMFGVDNTFGYLEYKLRLGYTPSPDITSPLEESVGTNEEDVVLFFAINASGEFCLVGAKPKNSEFSFDKIHPHLEGIEFLEVLY